MYTYSIILYLFDVHSRYPVEKTNINDLTSIILIWALYCIEDQCMCILYRRV